MQTLFEWSYRQGFASWCWFSLLANAAAAGVSVLGCWLIAYLFRRHRIFETQQPLTLSDLAYSSGAVVLNSSIAVIGWVLWKHGWIVIRETTFLRAVTDTILLISVMDFAMYLFHRVAHHPLIFPIVHVLHHRHRSTNPLSLFVLNPFEVLGFGLLLIVVLMLIPCSAGAVMAYLSFNLIFGTVGHLGVEPLPKWLVRSGPFRYLGTSTFHGLHHADLGYNFGFYTTIWDRLFRTLHPGYDGRFAAGPK